jgi:hypothetical protein
MNTHTPHWMVPTDLKMQGELRMLPRLIDWLQSVRWVREGSTLVQELALNGRRVDLATLTKSGTASAFELKLGGFGRVLEQAAYNQLSFDRSWVVVEGRPRVDNLGASAAHGVGVILVPEGHRPQVLVRPGPPNFDPALRKSVIRKFALIGGYGV